MGVKKFENVPYEDALDMTGEDFYKSATSYFCVIHLYEYRYVNKSRRKKPSSELDELTSKEAFVHLQNK